MTAIRSTGSRIKGTNGTSSGLIPWLKIYNDMLVACNQAGRRPGSGCVYLEPWHGDIEEFITLRTNTGDEQRKCRQLNIALWMPDLFFERLESDSHWTLFDPSLVKDLPELYGTDFKKSV
jgi:ribonucleoside-diphosphate reductase alpha chain